MDRCAVREWNTQSHSDGFDRSELCGWWLRERQLMRCANPGIAPLIRRRSRGRCRDEGPNVITTARRRAFRRGTGNAISQAVAAVSGSVRTGRCAACRCVLLVGRSRLRFADQRVIRTGEMRERFPATGQEEKGGQYCRPGSGPFRCAHPSNHRLVYPARQSRSRTGTRRARIRPSALAGRRPPPDIAYR